MDLYKHTYFHDCNMQYVLQSRYLYQKLQPSKDAVYYIKKLVAKGLSTAAINLELDKLSIVLRSDSVTQVEQLFDACIYLDYASQMKLFDINKKYKAKELEALFSTMCCQIDFLNVIYREAFTDINYKKYYTVRSPH